MSALSANSLRACSASGSGTHNDRRHIAVPLRLTTAICWPSARTNAVKQRLFSLLLFDEIEKEHPRILDKFLQILEDGRLTDGKGETVAFSETVIVFTSNIEASQVAPDTLDVRAAFVERVREHFCRKLDRSELLGRIGEGNIVPFNFIRSEDFLVDIARQALAIASTIAGGASKNRASRMTSSRYLPSCARPTPRLAIAGCPMR